MSNQFSHRNGEIEFPTLSGIYWTYNEFGNYRDLTQVAHMPTGNVQMRSLLTGSSWQTVLPERSKELGVQWFGPLVAPWEAS